MKKTFLFEVSWEVCNKVGGIHTVIKSKLPQIRAAFGDNYCLIGPLLDRNPGFEDEPGPDSTNVIRKLRENGITARAGRWNTPESPRVVLVKFTDTVDQNKLLFQLWEDYGVDSMSGGWDYIEPVLFSTVAGKAIAHLSGFYSDRQQAAQFHEWMCGAGLLYLKKAAPHIGTVFTTHATMLGRAMAGNGMDLYGQLEMVSPDAEAIRLNIVPKHTMECAAAREADCFTTVSDITALEAEHILNRKPDRVLPNGFMVEQTPDLAADAAARNKNREAMLEFAGKFLDKKLDPDKTLLVTTSGRYEYRNKGLDVLLAALGKLKTEAGDLPKDIVALLLVAAGSPGYAPDQPVPGRAAGIVTHPLWSPENDPVLYGCRRLQLENGPDDRVNVIFVPVYLNGNDGILNLEYYQALAGCDLSVYPSYYEPWGYTPLESIAYAVPTVSADLAGFGKWIIEAGAETDAVRVMRRLGTPSEKTADELAAHIREAAGWDAVRFKAAREQARKTAITLDWRELFGNYTAALTQALERCHCSLEDRRKAKPVPGQVFRGTDSQRPRFREFSVKAAVPAALGRLRDLAGNLWWSWAEDVPELFRRLDPDAFEASGYNPVRMIDMLPHGRLEEAVKDGSFMELYGQVTKRFDTYLQDARRLVETGPDITPERPAAYFSMEYGLHESLPIYSGGLGVLSGDHIKSSSDINLPLVGVGLLYKDGYFKQGISRAGEQQVEYYINDFQRMPVHEVRKNGEPVIITIDLPGRTLAARVWRIDAGRVPVYMLDTDMQQNTPSDRTITSRLYQGDKRVRIEQEIILGIGGIRLLAELNIEPSVYHLNEGHSAFLIIERLINLVKYSGLDAVTALELIKAGTVFTTHTPVPAGNEVFDFQLVKNYLKEYVENSGLAWRQVADLGHINPGDEGPFEMTVLALKNTCRRNGVSRLHGDVSRRMWAALWTGLARDGMPIGHITNGVHAGTWLNPEIARLLEDRGLLEDEGALAEGGAVWDRIGEIPDRDLWDTHCRLKERLVDTVRKKTGAAWKREGENPAVIDRFVNGFTARPLTIGFARRFATYKRADLFLRDPERLKRLVTDPDRPVQFVFAGKAHPDDKEAFGLIRSIAALAKDPEYAGRIIFVEGYNIRLARRMIAGCDVWLNNPRRPMEASGTSGQKAGCNGVLNFSVLDGWWDEAWNGKNGWAVGGRSDYASAEAQDRADADSLYDVLENEIIPAYYDRDPEGVPHRWTALMKESIRTVLPAFNTHRMLSDYVRDMYRPAAARYTWLADDGCARARSLGEWKSSVRSRFSSVHIESLTALGVSSETVTADDELRFTLEVSTGKLDSGELRAELVLAYRGDSGTEVLGYHGYREEAADERRVVPMMNVKEENGRVTYEAILEAEKSGHFTYGVRVVPYHADADQVDIADLNLVYWG